MPTQEELSGLPVDIEAERIVAGSCLLDPAALSAAVAVLTPEDFYVQAYGFVFRAAKTLHDKGQPVTAQSVTRVLAGRKVATGETALEVIGGTHMVSACLEGVDATQVAYWADIVRTKRAARDVAKLADRMRELATAPVDDADKLRAQVYETFQAHLGIEAPAELRYVGDHDGQLAELLERYIERPDEITGLATGWKEFDRMLDGCRLGNVATVYAPSSRFKSFFTANMGLAFARAGIAGIWYTTEMPEVQVEERLLQLDTRLNIRYLRRTGQIQQYASSLRQGLSRLGQYRIIVNDTSAPDVGAISGQVMRLAEQHGIEYVIIDLLDHVSSEKYSDLSTASEAHVMYQLKAMAKRANVAVILVSHIAKQERALRGKAVLDPEDMKGSSAKFQDADYSIGIMPVRWDIDKTDWVAMTREEIGIVTHNAASCAVLVDISKNRHGEIGRRFFELNLGHGGRFYELTQEQAMQLSVYGDPSHQPGE